ncbi:MAG: OmpA family protein [Polyangiaceae bacterium]|nr:OmpA family protein [Polyangiaceae bacterium]
MTAAGAARSQSTGGFALDQHEPAPAGDVFFGVPSPSAAGHLEPRSVVIFDYAARPIHLRTEDVDVVSTQAFLHFNASLALWDRLLVSANFPLAIAQSGDDPGIAGTTFTELSAPAPGDLRLGLRFRIWGDDGGPLQVGVGGNFYAPTGNQEQYTGDGAARGGGYLAVGGRIGSGVGFLWNAAGGAELTGSADSPHLFTFGAGAGVLFLQDMVQVGAEAYGAAPLKEDLVLSAAPETTTSAGTNAEVLFGAKLRLFGGFTIGAGAGPGIVKAVGTPAFRAVASIGWAPIPGAAAEKKETVAVAQVGDKDDDGIDDNLDACPDVKGDPSPDPAKDGCPPSDRDGDTVLDVDDACPTMAGVRSGDVTKNGCPVDTDGDGQHDGIDACKDVVGEASSDSKKNGCPPDRDDDGIADASDACPTAKGARSPDRKFNGCPEDPDGDGVKFGNDACPNEKGAPDPDPKQNGCPKFVRVTTDEIVTSKPVQFVVYGNDRTETVDPISDDLLHEVRDAIHQNPSIELVEVQGHTDDGGDAEFNLKLSQERADAVMNWLIKAGVPKEKLTAKGYGFERPLGDNRVKTGRQKHRRVQFMIVKRRQR